MNCIHIQKIYNLWDILFHFSMTTWVFRRIYSSVTVWNKLNECRSALTILCMPLLWFLTLSSPQGGQSHIFTVRNIGTTFSISSAPITSCAFHYTNYRLKSNEVTYIIDWGGRLHTSMDLIVKTMDDHWIAKNFQLSFSVFGCVPEVVASPISARHRLPETTLWCPACIGIVTFRWSDGGVIKQQWYLFPSFRK